MTGNLAVLDQTLIECDAHVASSRATGEAEEVLFVIAGSGALRLGSERHALEPDTGVYVPPGSEYVLVNEGSAPLRLVSVRIPDPARPEPARPEPARPEPARPKPARADPAGSEPAGPDPARPYPAPTDPAPPGHAASEENGRARVVVRRLADQDAEAATSERWFRIVADPRTGLRSATQFVGYIPPARADDHFHTYDEVIYVLEGEGTFHAGGARRPIGAGSCIELPAWTVHCLENTGTDVMRLVAVFRPAGSPAHAYYPDGTPAYPGTPPLQAP